MPHAKDDLEGLHVTRESKLTEAQKREMILRWASASPRNLEMLRSVVDEADNRRGRCDARRLKKHGHQRCVWKRDHLGRHQDENGIEFGYNRVT